ncbi:YihY/virulence factor BrkB family protein [Metabacillus litoralis]|uniref:YihY/virulence factor BrkB family protein n=1 Tax=Metabacillus litoralis TaxID=152268 RepID=A0A5C6VVK0_9BACI|nr:MULTISPECIES: YihY/virulence factor BrkB family protein [Metabacillus]MBM7605008.1 membrane protein [Metabacillus crassostreae]TXC89247.1 YihY/virulence factor BrkB family protein [Metabacillus litoralis]
MLKEGSFFKELLQRFTNDEVPGLSAQLSYFFLLSLFPFLIFLITLLGYLPISQVDVLNTIQEFAPGESMQLINETLDQILNNRNGGLLSFGIIATLWSASNGINAIVRAFNRAYDVKESRSFIVARGMAILLTIGMVFVIVVALLLPVFGKEIGLFIASNFGLSDQFLTIWNTLRWLVSGIILFIVFTALYFVAPNKRLHIKDGLPGAIAATIGWIVASLAFSYYVGNFANYSATYGSIGGIIVLMIWLYLSGMIIILGGELNAMLYKRKRAA